MVMLLGLLFEILVVGGVFFRFWFVCFCLFGVFLLKRWLIQLLNKDFSAICWLIIFMVIFFCLFEILVVGCWGFWGGVFVVFSLQR